MVELISRAQAVRELMPTAATMDDEQDGQIHMAEEMEDFNSLSNKGLADKLNEEAGYDADDEDRFVVTGDDDYVEPTIHNLDDWPHA